MDEQLNYHVDLLTELSRTLGDAVDQQLLDMFFGPPEPPRRPKLGGIKRWAEYRREYAAWRERYEAWKATPHETRTVGTVLNIPVIEYIEKRP